MTIWVVSGMLVLSMLFGVAGFGIGKKVERGEWVERDLKVAVKTIEKMTVIEKVNERVVVKWKDRERVIEVKSEEIKNEIPVIVRADCVLPRDFLLQLHAISRNQTVADTGLTEDAATGTSCRAALNALRLSYSNHYHDAEQLKAILEREETLDAMEKIR